MFACLPPEEAACSFRGVTDSLPSCTVCNLQPSCSIHLLGCETQIATGISSAKKSSKQNQRLENGGFLGVRRRGYHSHVPAILKASLQPLALRMALQSTSVWWSHRATST